MTIKHSDRCWWKAFGEATKRAFRRNDLEQKAYLYALYERHMHERFMREYLHYKQLEYDELRTKDLIEKRLGFFDWLEKAQG